MSKQDWASRKALQITARLNGPAYNGDIARLLRNEHGRAVRIVQKIQQTSFDAVVTEEIVHGYRLACVDILAAMQRGRKGER